MDGLDPREVLAISFGFLEVFSLRPDEVPIFR